MSEVIGMWGFFAAVSFIVWAVSSNARGVKMGRIKSEMQGRLLDKLANSQELAEWLKSDAGQRLMESASSEAVSPFKKILGSIQAGLVFALLGLALLIVSGRVADVGDGLLVLGAASVAIGLGFLISSGISFGLSKSMGLLNGKDHSGR